MIKRIQNPLRLEIDLQDQVAYISYLDDVTVAGTVDVWEDGWVAADVDDQGRVIGIEVLDLKEETLRNARDYAAKHDLMFPNLRGYVDLG